MTHVKTILFVLLLGGTVLAADTATIPEPVLDGGDLSMPTFGDARNVELFAGLLDDEDVRVRERAAAELGQTHNPAALLQLRRAMKDSSPAVRAAAVRGAAELAAGADAVILDGLRDKDDAPILAAMQASVTLKLRAAGDAIRKLTRHERESLRYSALRTLTALRQPAGADDLKQLLNDPSPAVRVETLSNALLLKSANDLRSDFLRLAENSNPVVVRAAAIECLGAFVLNSKPAAEPQPTTAPTTAPTKAAVARRASPWSGLGDYAKIGNETNPLLRRAVVRVYQRQKMAGKILPFLADPSPLVRRAAARAMVHLPNPQALDPLVNVFLNAADDETHNAAKRALRNIGGAPVGKAAAENLSRSMAGLKTNEDALKQVTDKLAAFTKTNPASREEKLDPKVEQELQELHARSDSLQRQKLQLQRNAVSCCYLLGVLKRREGFDELLRLSTSLPLNSPILGEVAVALGRIGDARAIAPLQKVLDECGRQAIPYLQAMTTMAAPPPFSEKVTGQVIQALSALGDKNSIDAVLRLTKLNVMSMRLGTVIGYALRAIPAMTTDEKQADVEKMILGCLMDRNLPSIVQWRAAKLAGEMKLAKALKPLQIILNQHRKCMSLMTVSAWAIQQIAGGETPPKIPQPIVRQGDWIITQIE